jgi:hypothetical protein
MADLGTINGTAEDNVAIVNGAADDTLGVFNGLTWVHESAEVIYQGFSGNNTPSSPQSLTSMPIGTASATRYVIVGIYLSSGNPGSVSAVTVAGTACTKLDGAAASVEKDTSLWITNSTITTGTTATVAVSFATAGHTLIAATWASYASSGSKTASDSDAGSGVRTNSLNVPAGGWCVSVFSAYYQPFSFTGVTEDAETTDYENFSLGMASDEFVGAQSPLVVTCTPTIGFQDTLVSASFAAT